MNGNNAVEVHETGQFKVLYPEPNGREGLYVNTLALLFNVFPSNVPWVIRLPAAVAGVLTVLGVYLFVVELFGDDPALLAAFLLATSFWHIIFSRIGFRAILAPLLLTWSLWLLIKAFKAVSVAKTTWGYAILAGIVYGLGFYTYIAYRITPLLFLLLSRSFTKCRAFEAGRRLYDHHVFGRRPDWMVLRKKPCRFLRPHGASFGHELFKRSQANRLEHGEDVAHVEHSW